MRTVTNDYLAQVQSSARQFDFKVRVYGNSADGDEIPLADIISIDIVRSISDQLQIGACMSAKLTLQTKATTLFGGRLKKVEVYCRCKSPVTAWEQLGTFYVDESVTKSGVTAVIAYDKTARFDKKTSWIDTGKAQAPTFPCKMQAVLNYLCARAGMTTDFTCEDITITNAPDGYTARELISYIAASHGANAYVAPNEVLKIVPYAQVNKVVEHDRCYAMDISGGDYTVKGILFDRGGDNKIYTDGTASEYDADADGIVSAYNPFATVGIAEYAWNRLGGLKYSAASLEMPAENILEVGDVFTVKDADGTEKKAIVMEQSLSVSSSGGFVERISCSAESKAQTRDVNNRSESTEKKIDSDTTAQKLQTGAAVTFAVTDGNGLIVQNGSAQAVILPSVSGGKETVVIKPGQGFPILSLAGSGADGGEAHIGAPYLMADLTPQRLYYNGGKSGHTVEVSGSAQGVITLHTDSNDLNIRWGGEAYQLRLNSAGLTISAGGKQLLALDVGGDFAIGAGDTVLRNSSGVLTFGGKAVLTGD